MPSRLGEIWNTPVCGTGNYVDSGVMTQVQLKSPNIPAIFNILHNTARSSVARIPVRCAVVGVGMKFPVGLVHLLLMGSFVRPTA